MLIEAVASYLAVRRRAGFGLTRAETLLRRFAQFASARGETHVGAETAVDWARLASSPRQRGRRLSIVTHFARHARAENARHEIPPSLSFGHHPDRRVPYLFSPTDIRRLLEATSRLGPPGSLRPSTYRTLFGLLWSTGLRISEARALRMEDLGPDGLVIRETKFRKSRLVPLPRGLSPEEVGRVLAQCPSTPRGLRDRAVLLLLIRLGLRAGDVKRLRFSDLCFDTAAIRVSGKDGRAVRLPLPQDVGDALLAYLRGGRPSVDSEFVFLRLDGTLRLLRAAASRQGGGAHRSGRLKAS